MAVTIGTEKGFMVNREPGVRIGSQDSTNNETTATKSYHLPLLLNRQVLAGDVLFSINV